MPYLNPPDETYKAEEYFYANKDRICRHIEPDIDYGFFEDLEIFVSIEDNEPYLVIILKKECHYTCENIDVEDFHQQMVECLESYPTFPEMDRAHLNLADMFLITIVKRSDEDDSGFEKIWWPDEAVEEEDRYGE
ncbi:uncharacterized protein F4822DRAFT_432573 [Hypoxylon trugodes]|uniref:uncharacterized protein n=1 Tax=Hypoxylon trugodes TaxID=326681 RepID=UPI00218F649F|nr:uncharacterized protein F4822DRAFT_432573 [Hypoxylon trugodes]KAI1385719.1 hypothetical protein F4822DRAFT_432573 [Hypoxylon trugodes]